MEQQANNFARNASIGEAPPQNLHTLSMATRNRRGFFHPQSLALTLGARNTGPASVP